MSDSCPILTGNFGGHHHHHHKSNTSSSSSSSACESHLSPVVNEKSPQSIIMDHTLGKKSINGTAAKYWRRNGGPMVSMGPNGKFDASGFGAINLSIFIIKVLSLGGSSTCISSEHPYSDAASCTSSPVYAELDASVAGSHHYGHTPSPMIGPPYYHHHHQSHPFGNAYSEVPDNMARNGSILSDSTYDHNAAYLSAQPPGPFYNGTIAGTANSRSLRRLAATRSMQTSVMAQNSAGSFTPLLAGHPYHYQPMAATMTMQQQPASQNGQFHFLTGGRSLAAKKPRHGQQQLHSTPQARSSISSSNTGNHYVEHQTNFGGHNGTLISDIEPQHHQQLNAFSSFLDSTGGSARKLSAGNGLQYTEMPLLSSSPFGGVNTYRGGREGMSETHSNQDLNSSASSSSGGGGHGSGSSGTSLKRPLPPVPSGGSGVRL